MEWHETVDFLVCGSGMGMVGAIRAHDLGMKTLVIEKAPKIGGSAAHSFGEMWCPNNHLMRERGLKDSIEEALTYLDHTKGPFPVDEKVRRKFVEMSPVVVEYLDKKADVKFQIIEGFADTYHPCPGSKAEGRYLEPQPFKLADLGDFADKLLISPHVPYMITHNEMFAWGGIASYKEWDFDLIKRRIAQGMVCLGTGLLGYILRAVLKRGIQVRIEERAVRLLIEGSRVIGVKVARKDGTEYNIRARKGVLLNVGGCGWHPFFPLYYDRVPEYYSVEQPSIEGDHIILGGEIGAMILTTPGFYPTLVYHIPGEEWFGKPLYRIANETGLPHSIVVNKEGKRYADESHIWKLWFETIKFDFSTHSWPNIPAFFIFDEQYRQKYVLGSIEPGKPFPKGFVEVANTLEELAEKLSINKEEFAKTVKRFNEFAKKGVDDDFGRGSFPWSNKFLGDSKQKPNPNLGTIEKPPFYGLKLRIGGVGVGSAGYKIDEYGRVFHVRGKPIEGLYACGNCVAMTEFAYAYQDGGALMRSAVFAYVSAEHASTN
jgi:succinate dehydrogenase/fumarate reductase flavoprotein subunit